MQLHDRLPMTDQLNLFDVEIPRQRTWKRSIRLIEPCLLCARNHGWYESVLANIRPELRDLYRMTCESCRHRYIGVIKTHRLDTATAMRLISADRCELCNKPFAVNSKGRKQAVIDHSHACCKGEASCGRCVRGILCQRCNHSIASVEAVDDIGLDVVLRYLRAHE